MSRRGCPGQGTGREGDMKGSKVGKRMNCRETGEPGEGWTVGERREGRGGEGEAGPKRTGKDGSRGREKDG